MLFRMGMWGEKKSLLKQKQNLDFVITWSHSITHNLGGKKHSCKDFCLKMHYSRLTNSRLQLVEGTSYEYLSMLLYLIKFYLMLLFYFQFYI